MKFPTRGYEKRSCFFRHVFTTTTTPTTTNYQHVYNNCMRYFSKQKKTPAILLFWPKICNSIPCQGNLLIALIPFTSQVHWWAAGFSELTANHGSNVTQRTLADTTPIGCLEQIPPLLCAGRWSNGGICGKARSTHSWACVAWNGR